MNQGDRATHTPVSRPSTAAAWAPMPRQVAGMTYSAGPVAARTIWGDVPSPSGRRINGVAKACSFLASAGDDCRTATYARNRDGAGSSAGGTVPGGRFCSPGDPPVAGGGNRSSCPGPRGAGPAPLAALACPYCIDASLMHFLRHERGTHAIRPRAAVSWPRDPQDQPGSTRFTEISGRLRSLTLVSRPCRVPWSVTWP
jgi:hypothetical protein